MDCCLSNVWPQASHRYSYVGISQTPEIDCIHFMSAFKRIVYLCFKCPDNNRLSALFYCQSASAIYFALRQIPGIQPIHDFIDPGGA
jgi:hypothetical protein